MIFFSGRARTLVCVSLKFFGQSFPFGIFFQPFSHTKKTTILFKYVYSSVELFHYFFYVGSKRKSCT